MRENSVSEYRKQVANKQKDEVVNENKSEEVKDTSSTNSIYLLAMVFVILSLAIGICIGHFLTQNTDTENITPTIINNITIPDTEQVQNESDVSVEENNTPTQENSDDYNYSYDYDYGTYDELDTDEENINYEDGELY